MTRRTEKAVIGIEAKENVRKGVKDAERQLNGLKKPMMDIQKLAGSVFGAIGLGMAVHATINMAKLGAQTQNVRRAFMQLDDATDMLKELKEATHGAVSEFNLMQSSLVALDLGANAEQLKTFAQFARLEAVRKGSDALETFRNIISGVLRGSTELLDNFGFSLTALNKKVEELAKRGGRVATSLSAVERREMAVIAATEMMNERLAAAGRIMTTDAERMAGMGAQFDNFKRAAGELIDTPLAYFFESAAWSLGLLQKALKDETGELWQHKDAIDKNIEALQFQLAVVEGRIKLNAINIEQARRYGGILELLTKTEHYELTTIEGVNAALAEEIRLRKIAAEMAPKTPPPPSAPEADIKPTVGTLDKYNQLVIAGRQKMNDVLFNRQKMFYESLEELTKEYQEKRQEGMLAREVWENEIEDRIAEHKRQKVSDAEEEVRRSNRALEQMAFARLEVQQQIASGMTDLLHAFSSESKAAFDAYKAMSIVETLVSTYAAAQKAYQSMIGVPFAGPGLAAAAAAAATFQGLARVKMIQSQEYAGFQYGGSFMVPGAGGPDSQLVAFRASPREMVTITPPGQVTNNNQQTTTVVHNHINAVDARTFQDFMRRDGYKVMLKDLGRDKW